MRTIFTLANARSGTRFLYEIIHRNAARCVVRHETYFRNPSMFGQPIYDHAHGHTDAIRVLLKRKQRAIQRYAPAVYVETSHSFLKSYYDIAPEFFPNLGVVHLIRAPLKVAKSNANREELIRRWRLPFVDYRAADGRKYFRWTLTGSEPVYQPFVGEKLSRFQWYLLEWIEIENRAMWFLREFGDRVKQVTLRVPEDINDAEKVRRMMQELDLPLAKPELQIEGWQNQTPGTPTRIAAEDSAQASDVLRRLPAEYLAIFDRPPYDRCTWRDGLLASVNGAPSS